MQKGGKGQPGTDHDFLLYLKVCKRPTAVILPAVCLGLKFAFHFLL
jgi:hypothetical protein